MGRAALIVVVGSSLIMGRMLIGMNEQSNTQLEEIMKHYTGIISRNIANSAASMAVSELYRDFDWRTGLDSTYFTGGEFEVMVEDVNFDTSLTVERVKVTSIAWYADRTDTTVVIVAKPPFSHYASFSHTFPNNLAYATGDTLWGPVHTNGQLGIYGSPVFFGKVTMTSSTYKVYGSNPDPQFLGGIEYGADSVPLPDYSSGLTALTDSANSGGEVFSSNVWIKFFAGVSKYKYRYGGYPPDETGGWDGSTNLADINGIIMSDPGVDIHVKGTLSGQVTIFSGRHIYIEDDIVYAQDPRSYPNSQDMLGLVATKDVIVADNPDTNEDLEIHAAILALDKSFKVDDYSERGGLVGTLTTVGSIVQDVIAPYRTLSSGYYESSIYDERFLQVGPPVFPLVNRALVYSWHETASNSGYGTVSEIVNPTN